MAPRAFLAFPRRAFGALACLALAAPVGCTERAAPVAAPRKEVLTRLAVGTPAKSAAAQPTAPIVLRDVTGATGITFVHTDGSTGEHYIVESVSAGLVLFDADDDGLEDIYFVNGAPLTGAPSDRPPRDALYRNRGDWRFEEITERAGAGHTGFGLGAAAADYDNDGDQDLYVSNFGPKVLYRNEGGGQFVDVTEAAGVADGNKVGAGVCFLDIEGDGDLDLYVANYVRFTVADHKPLELKGYPAYRGPTTYGGVRDTLFRNNGDGTFSDISAEAGIAAAEATGMGIVAADYDDDGDTDIFVANDGQPNLFWQNDGRGHFEDVALYIGAAYDINGDINGSMGVECGDYDNDGRLDFFMTDYQNELPVLYRNMGGGLLRDVSAATGAGTGAYQHVTWGSGLVDFDNDGDRDLYMACGHLQDHIEHYNPNTAYRVRNILLMNDGTGHFQDISPQAGDGMLVCESSRGAAFDDLDRDGRVDVVVLNARARPTVLRNESPGGNHWLEVTLQGVKTNRDGIGARVRVVAGDLVQIDEVHSGRGYQSHYGRRLHFGLGQRTAVDRVEVRWLGGATETFQVEGVDRRVTLVEGSGKPGQ